MALQLFLDNEAADLPANARVRLNQASNAAEQLDMRIGERSYAFTLPATRTNDRLLAHARQQLQLRKFNRATDLTARLVADGVDVLPAGAVCRLNAAERDGYEVVLYAPGVALGELLAAKNLRDLTTLRKRDYANYISLQEVITSNRTADDLAAPLVAYGNFFGADDTQPLNTVDTAMRLDDYVLSVYALNVLEACFREAGYQLQGSLLTAPAWQRVVLPYTSAEPFPWPWRTMLPGDDGPGACQVNWSRSAGHTYAGDQLGLLSFLRTPYEGYMGELLYMGDGGTGVPDVPVYVATNCAEFFRFQAPTAGTYRLRGDYTYTYMGSGPQPRVRVAVFGGNEVARVDFVTPATGPTGSTSYDYTVTVEGPCTIAILAVDPTPGSGPAAQSLGLDVELTDGPTQLDPALLLPALNQKDFVKAILTMTNATFTVDDERKTVTLVPRDALTAQQLANALDLDGFVDPAGFGYRPAAQFNAVNFTYAVDSKDAVAVPGSDDTTVPLPSAGRAESKEISVPFAATSTRDYLYVEPAPGTGRVTHTLACLASQEALDQKRSESRWSYDYVPRLLVVTEQFTRTLPMFRRHDTYTESIYYVDGRQEGLNWASLVDAHYATTLELLDGSELVTAEILLTPTLYRELRPGRVVRVNGVIYVVNKLDGYEPGSTRPATLELLRYLPPSGRL